MPYELVTNCPRCGAKHITFDVHANNHVGAIRDHRGGNPWQNRYEAFSVCRNCQRATLFRLLQVKVTADPFHPNQRDLPGSLNNYFKIESFVSIKDEQHEVPPEFVPKEIESIFKEGATCLTVQCFNAAGTMFRLCVDMATRDLLPKQDANGLDNRTRHALKPRIDWLLANNILPPELLDLSSCIREDGNDGAHAGTLTHSEASDLLDFTTLLLERVYAHKERLKLAQHRRDTRRATAKAAAKV